MPLGKTASVPINTELSEDAAPLWIKVSDGSTVKSLKSDLERSKEFDKTRKIIKHESEFYLPVKTRPKNSLEVVELPLHVFDPTIKVSSLPLKEKLQKLRYSIYPPMVLINSKDCDLTVQKCSHILEDGGAAYFGRSDLTHMAINSPLIPGDVVRRPTNIKPLYGDFGFGVNNITEATENPCFESAFWCSSVQNGIIQFWAPLHTMFSRGNIREKTRILNDYQNIEGTDVVDLYSGIGYFTLCYAKRGAKRVFCWDLNPYSIEGLRRGAKANGFEQTIFAHLEDNANCVRRLSEIKDLCISHINMGLLPDCKLMWQTAVEIASNRSLNNSDKTVLHIHENVAEADIPKWCIQTLETLRGFYEPTSFEHVEKIKTFAPGIYHICGDFVVHNNSML